MNLATRDRSLLGDPSTGVRAVLFDFGGVLSKSPFEAFSRYEEANGIPRGFIRSLNAADHHENAWARLERGEVSLAEFSELFEEEARRAGHPVNSPEVLALLAGELRPRMIDVVRTCRKRYLIGLLTNNFLAPAGRPSAFSGRSPPGEVVSLFDEVVESSRVGVRKPEIAFFEIALDRLDIEADEAVFVDDLGVNLKPARALGMRTIKFVSEEQAISDLEQTLRMKLV